MSVRIAFVSAVFLAFASGGAYSQPQPKPTIPQPSGPNIPAVYPPLPPAPVTVLTPPPPPSIDELLNALERIQAQKAELEKQEKELKTAIRKKLDEQAERVKKLGVAPAPKDAKEPDRVGRIIIEGNTKTADKKILEKLDFRPGQVLNYPLLETSRINLEKAGFRGATVEVETIPNELDPTFKDVRVKVDESRPASDPIPIPRVPTPRD